MRLLTLFSTGLIFFVIQTNIVSAQTNKTDIEVATRAVKFLETPPSGNAIAYIVFDPGNAASVADADAIEGVIGSGIDAGSAKLTAQRVPVSDIGTLGGAGVVFVTAGLGANHGAIQSALNGKSLISISSDLSCVQAKACVVGVATKPKVRILISQDAASAAGVGFKAAFLLLAEKV